MSVAPSPHGSFFFPHVTIRTGELQLPRRESLRPGFTFFAPRGKIFVKSKKNDKRRRRDGHCKAGRSPAGIFQQRRDAACRRAARGASGAARRALLENEGKIAEALRADLNKSAFEAYMTETGMVLDEIRFHLRHLEMWAKPIRVKTPLSQAPARSFILPEPYGVALIAAPWNYPLQLCLEPLVGALSAGCCAVVKPSAYAPAASHLVAGSSEDVSSRIRRGRGGRRAENKALFAQKFDYIFFTGSVAVGKRSCRGRREPDPVTLELGGKSPVIVDETADIRLAARRVPSEALNAGQTSSRRITCLGRNARRRTSRGVRKRPSGLLPGRLGGVSRHRQRKAFCARGRTPGKRRLAHGRGDGPSSPLRCADAPHGRFAGRPRHARGDFRAGPAGADL